MMKRVFFRSSCYNRKRTNLRKDSNTKAQELPKMVVAYIYTDSVTQQRHTGKVCFIIYYTNIHLHVSLSGNPNLSPVTQHLSRSAPEI
jgi:hypothetical protein